MYVVICNRDNGKFVAVGADQEGPILEPFEKLRTNTATPLRFTKHQVALLIAEEWTRFGKDIYRVEQYFK